MRGIFAGWVGVVETTRALRQKWRGLATLALAKREERREEAGRLHAKVWAETWWSDDAALGPVRR